MSDGSSSSSPTTTVPEQSSSESGDEIYSPRPRTRKKKGIRRISVTTVTTDIPRSENENTNIINRAVDEKAVILTFNTLIEQLLIVGKKYNGIDSSKLNELSKLSLIVDTDDYERQLDDGDNIGKFNRNDVDRIKNLQMNQRIMINSFKPPDELKRRVDTKLDQALTDKRALVNIKAFTIINNICSGYDIESNGGIFYENMKTEFVSEIIHADQLFMDTLRFDKMTLELVHIFNYLKKRRNPLYCMICRKTIEMIYKTALHEDSGFIDKYFMPKRVGLYYAIIVNFALSNPRTKPLILQSSGENDKKSQ